MNALLAFSLATSRKSLQNIPAHIARPFSFPRVTAESKFLLAEAYHMLAGEERKRLSKE